MFDDHLLLLAAGMSLSVVCAALVLFHTGRIYSTWARLAAVLACIFGLSWGSLGIVLMHWQSFHITRHTYFVLLAAKHIFAGISLGILFSILLARPYQKKDRETSHPRV